MSVCQFFLLWNPQYRSTAQEETKRLHRKRRRKLNRKKNLSFMFRILRLWSQDHGQHYQALQDNNTEKIHLKRLIGKAGGHIKYTQQMFAQ